MNTITSDYVIELLKQITDSKLCEKNINLATFNENNDDFEYSAPYSLKEVDDHLLKRYSFPEKDSSFDDLNIEINNTEDRFLKIKGKQVESEHVQPVHPDPKQDMFLGKMQILYPPIILGTPFINAIYPFTRIDVKGFSTKYKDNEITYSFVTDLVTRDINALINMKQSHIVSLQLELFNMNILDSLKYTKTATFAGWIHLGFTSKEKEGEEHPRAEEIMIIRLTEP
ncbi:hypothetical protein H5410_031268 [Solanum commersonii]|uniref:Uncharacterized protein n=1 Tax=Solanum commersonii TaxID=4109 RepID=A0A9J5YHW3_SOLCO|nr:hypothetical protein H5410_031268 [Solanum commersonii]